jgi:hypothetical protein
MLLIVLSVCKKFKGHRSPAIDFPDCKELLTYAEDWRSIRR